MTGVQTCALPILLGLIAELHARGQTVVLVTHDAGIASRAQRTVRMRDGRIVS